jgi:hypothetical protein
MANTQISSRPPPKSLLQLLLVMVVGVPPVFISFSSNLGASVVTFGAAEVDGEVEVEVGVGVGVWVVVEVGAGVDGAVRGVVGIAAGFFRAGRRKGRRWLG